MKAVVIHAYGDATQLKYEDAEIPEVGENDVLVHVRTTSINPIDYKMRSGAAKDHFPVKFPGILGRDLAGEVEKAGSAVTGFPKKMRVMGLAHATYAEYAVARADVLCPIPEAMDYIHAAALPLVATTGAQLIERAVKPTAGQTVLVTGATGSVGRAAVHVARKHGARVLAGVRAAQRKEAASLGAAAVIALDDESETEKLHDLDAIADTVGGLTIARLLKAIRSGGVLGSVVGVPEAAKQYNIRVEAFTAQPDAARLYQLAEEVTRGEFIIPIACTMPLSQIQEAHRLAESSGTHGKIVLTP